MAGLLHSSLKKLRRLLRSTSSSAFPNSNWIAMSQRGYLGSITGNPVVRLRGMTTTRCCGRGGANGGACRGGGKSCGPRGEEGVGNLEDGVGNSGEGVGNSEEDGVEVILLTSDLVTSVGTVSPLKNSAPPHGVQTRTTGTQKLVENPNPTTVKAN
jgi:hypothetical protein